MVKGMKVERRGGEGGWYFRVRVPSSRVKEMDGLLLFGVALEEHDLWGWRLVSKREGWVVWGSLRRLRLYPSPPPPPRFLFLLSLGDGF